MKVASSALLSFFFLIYWQPKQDKTVSNSIKFTKIIKSMSKFHLCLAYLLVCASLSTAFAQKNKKRPLEAEVDVPNCTWMDTIQVHAEQTEICNIHWLEYCKWLKENAPEKYTAALPDTTVWNKVEPESGKISSYTANYFRYDGFRFFPVVGVSKAQVEEFCKWRSKLVTDNYQRHINQKRKGIYKTYDLEIIYRLPTQREWELMAQARTQDPHGFQPLTPKQKRRQFPNSLRANCKKEQIINGEIDKNGALITEYLFAYTPNQYGFYNMIGNVAEMVQEEGVGKGGSWYHTLAESTIQAQQTYTSPTAWLGFRCVAEVKLTPRKVL
jgi:formylglycine-generating enzyme required for sulfatase activity